MTNNDQGSQTETVRSFQFNRPTIIALLYIGTIISGISGVAGLVLAYIWQNEPTEAWEDNQYSYLIRTFWIPVCVMLVSMLVGVAVMAVLEMHILLAVMVIGGVVVPILTIWGAVRVIKSIVAAQRRQGLLNPKSWLW